MLCIVYTLLTYIKAPWEYIYIADIFNMSKMWTCFVFYPYYLFMLLYDTLGHTIAVAYTLLGIYK